MLHKVEIVDRLELTADPFRISAEPKYVRPTLRPDLSIQEGILCRCDHRFLRCFENLLRYVPGDGTDPCIM